MIRSKGKLEYRDLGQTSTIFGRVGVVVELYMVGDPDFLTSHSQIGVILPTRECLETFLVVTAGERDATGIWWVEPWGAAQRPAVRGLPSQQRVSGPICEPFTPSVPLNHSVHPGNRSVQPPGTLYWVHDNEGGSAYKLLVYYIKYLNYENYEGSKCNLSFICFPCY